MFAAAGKLECGPPITKYKVKNWLTNTRNLQKVLKFQNKILSLFRSHSPHNSASASA